MNTLASSEFGPVIATMKMKLTDRKKYSSIERPGYEPMVLVGGERNTYAYAEHWKSNWGKVPTKNIEKLLITVERKLTEDEKTQLNQGVIFESVMNWGLHIAMLNPTYDEEKIVLNFDQGTKSPDDHWNKFDASGQST